MDGPQDVPGWGRAFQKVRQRLGVEGSDVICRRGVLFRVSWTTCCILVGIYGVLFEGLSRGRSDGPFDEHNQTLFFSLTRFSDSTPATWRLPLVLTLFDLGNEDNFARPVQTTWLDPRVQAYPKCRPANARGGGALSFLGIS
ncbi:hypothetical protein LZ31DRAFT_286625 [Colletotrichum somersetense]|nr:hypothetical protein LZ31DRAFT_286625 [Colletotrichum somersetense]